MNSETKDTLIHGDLVRTIAILLVIIVHSCVSTFVLVPPKEDTFNWWIANIYDSIARLGVPLLIMISGFHLLQPNKIEEPLKIFVRKRLKRLLIPFFFWSFVFFTWNYLISGIIPTPIQIFQGLLGVPYYHFWFLYTLMGLYILTPLLRLAIADENRKILDYLIIITVIGATIVPLITLIHPFYISKEVFLLNGYTGYFLIGSRLRKTHLNLNFLIVLLISGISVTAVGTWFLSVKDGVLNQFFYDYLSPPIFVASIAMFLLLSNVRSIRFVTKSDIVSWVVRKIARNTLPIFMLHPIIMISLQDGYFGFKISATELPPFLEIPLITVATLAISFVIVHLVGMIPYARKIIG